MVAAIILAIIVSVILAPLVLALRSRGKSRNAAAGIVWVVAIGAVLGLAMLLVVAFLPYIGELLDRLQQGHEEMEQLTADAQLPAWIDDLMAQALATLKDAGSGAISDLIGRIANLAGILLLGSFLLFFFLRDGDKAWMWLFQSMPEEKREHVTSTGDDALRRVGDYVRATSVLAAIAAVTNWAFMLLLGTPLALPLAVFTFVTAYIPYFGGAISALVVLGVTLGAVDTEAAMLMAALIAARWLSVRMLLQGRMYDQALTLHPVVILIVLPIGFQLGGLIGLILAVPITAVGFSVGQAAIDIIEPEAPADLPELVPGWLDRAAQWSWRAIVALIFVAVLIVVLMTLPLVVLPVILALILAATVIPLVNALVARGQTRSLAAAVSVGGSALAIIGVLALALGSLVNQIGEVGETATSGAQSVNDAAGGYLGLGSDAVSAGVEAGSQLISGWNDELVGLAVMVILAVLLTFYFLRDGAGLWEALMSHVPADAAAELSAAGGRAFGVLGGYMLGTGAISLVGAASQAVIMWVLGMPLVMPIFVLSLFGGFIPYIGSALTTALAFLVAVSTGDSVDIIVMGIWTLVFNVVQGNVVAPLVYNRTTHIHPAIVLAAIPAGSAVAGILGMFLVVPVLGVVGTTWRSLLRIMGGDEDELPRPPADERARGDAGEDVTADHDTGPPAVEPAADGA